MNNKYSYNYEDRGAYTYPNSYTLRNKLNIEEEQAFFIAERAFASARQMELNERPLLGHLDFDHLKAIHLYLFQDLFYWVGEIRTVAIAKQDLFCLPQFIESYAKEVFGDLKKQNYFLGINKDALIIKIASFLADLNALHPFREGNGRAQREFIRYLTGINGFGLDWSLITSEENIIASHESVNGNNSKMINLISKIIFPLDEKQIEVFKPILWNLNI